MHVKWWGDEGPAGTGMKLSLFMDYSIRVLCNLVARFERLCSIAERARECLGRVACSVMATSQ